MFSELTGRSQNRSQLILLSSRVAIQLVDYLCNNVCKICHIKVVILANDNFCLIVHWVVLYRLAGREF